jgi:hypothetical protein
MDYTPSVQEVQGLIEDYARDFGETLPYLNLPSWHADW